MRSCRVRCHQAFSPEALKTQAVCARSYVYMQLMRADLAAYGAHINDSTSYQVYNKVEKTKESVAAVDATCGQVLTWNGKVVEAYYFRLPWVTQTPRRSECG